MVPYRRNVHSGPKSVLIGLLRMLTASTRLDTGTAGQWLFSFSDPTSKDQRQVVGLWHDDKMPDTTLRLHVGSRAKCSLRDLYGNDEPVTVGADGLVQVPLKHVPAFVLITGGDAVAASH